MGNARIKRWVLAETDTINNANKIIDLADILEKYLPQKKFRDSQNSFYGGKKVF